MSSELRELLEDYNDSSRAWIDGLDLSVPPSEIYARCQDGEWLLWIVENSGVDERIVVPAACELARLVLPHCADPRPRAAVARAEAWVRGDATLDDVRAAAAAAAEAVIAAGHSDLAREIARAAYHAASAADATSDRGNYHATAAASFTILAAVAAAVEPLSNAAAVDFLAHCEAIRDAADNTMNQSAQQCAAVVRKHIPFARILEAQLHGSCRDAIARSVWHERTISEWSRVPSG